MSKDKNNKDAIHIGLVVSQLYPKIEDMLIEGAVNAIDQSDKTITYDIFRVSGALEIPLAIANLKKACHSDKTPVFSGFVALGCVIRGKTYHYEIVANQSAQALMQLGLMDNLAIGNGILTVDDEPQAMSRADPNLRNRGGGALNACLSLINLQHTYNK